MSLKSMLMSKPNCLNCAGTFRTSKTSRCDAAVKFEILPWPFIRWMQLIGLFPCASNPALETVKAAYSRRLLIGSCGWLVFTTFCNVSIIVVNWVTTYRSRLEKMEFFTLISFCFILNVVLLGPLNLLWMMVKAPNFARLLLAIQKINEEVLKKPFSSARRIFQIIIIGWNLIYIGALLTGQFLLANTLVNLWKLDWTFSQKTLFTAVDVPLYGITILQAVITSLSLVYQNVPPLLAIYFALHLRAGFRRLRELLQKGEVTIGSLRKTMHNYQKLQCAVAQLNSVFSMVMLLHCINDVMSATAIIAAAMQTDQSVALRLIVTVRANLTRELQAEYDIKHEAEKTERLLLWYVVGITAVGACNTVLRLVMCISCHETAQSIRGVILEISCKTPDEQLQRECLTQSRRIRDYDGALSACGFFYLIKEYVTTLAGLLLTYGLLIYQTRDSKLEMQQLVTAVANLVTIK